jgi:hypothetical protein
MIDTQAITGVYLGGRLVEIEPGSFRMEQFQITGQDGTYSGSEKGFVLRSRDRETVKGPLSAVQGVRCQDPA